MRWTLRELSSPDFLIYVAACLCAIVVVWSVSNTTLLAKVEEPSKCSVQTIGKEISRSGKSTLRTSRNSKPATPPVDPFAAQLRTTGEVRSFEL